GGEEEGEPRNGIRIGFSQCLSSNWKNLRPFVCFKIKKEREREGERGRGRERTFIIAGDLTQRIQNFPALQLSIEPAFVCGVTPVEREIEVESLTIFPRIWILLRGRIDVISATLLQWS